MESPTGSAVDPSQDGMGEGLTLGGAPLPEREALLRAILETSPDGLITIDEDGIIQSFNPAAERMFGYNAAEVIGRNVSCLMPSPYREEHDGYLARFLRTGERRIIGIGREVLGQRKDGTIFPHELTVGEVKAGGRRLFAGFLEGRERAPTERTAPAGAAGRIGSRRAPERDGRDGLGDCP